MITMEMVAVNDYYGNGVINVKGGKRPMVKLKMYSFQNKGISQV